ncbi:hypothetical protein [Enterobacter sp. JMULE2]|uniref:hypothetical protein n=1 Tax=Enterobacter sp. JMULE2 TaxID=2518340 RepID=UPI001575517F|nr:hypothetical protein [Enterobacter sp. JMULE2]
MKEQETRHDRLALRLSVIISRLMAGESLALRPLSEEFGVSLRPSSATFSSVCSILIFSTMAAATVCGQIRSGIIYTGYFPLSVTPV